MPGYRRLEPRVIPDLSTSILDRLRSASALMLWRAGAVRVDLEEPFRLASGNRSPIYVNCRQVLSDPVFMGLFLACARCLLADRGVASDAVAGGETAGIPYAAYLAQGLDRSMLYVRKKPKGYGIATRVEGHVSAGARVLMVEDLVTDGGSKLGFIDALREAGAVVEDVLVLFDRQQGGEELLAGHGCRLHSITDRASALAEGERCGLLTAAERRSVDEYFADAVRWHEERGFEFQAV